MKDVTAWRILGDGVLWGRWGVTRNDPEGWFIGGQAVYSHLWSQGPGPWHPLPPFPADIDALCGETIRRGLEWRMVNAMTAEFLLHMPDESERICDGCLRALAARPVRCSAGQGCTSNVLCAG